MFPVRCGVEPIQTTVEICETIVREMIDNAVEWATARNLVRTNPVRKMQEFKVPTSDEYQYEESKTREAEAQGQFEVEDPEASLLNFGDMSADGFQLYLASMQGSLCHSSLPQLWLVVCVLAYLVLFASLDVFGKARCNFWRLPSSFCGIARQVLFFADGSTSCVPLQPLIST